MRRTYLDEFWLILPPNGNTELASIISRKEDRASAYQLCESRFSFNQSAWRIDDEIVVHVSNEITSWLALVKVSGIAINTYVLFDM